MHTNDTSISKGCVRDPWLCHVMKRNGKMWAVVGRTPLWAFDIQFEEFEAVTIYFFRSKIIYISWIHDIPYVSMTGKRKCQANWFFHREKPILKIGVRHCTFASQNPDQLIEGKNAFFFYIRFSCLQNRCHWRDLHSYSLAQDERINDSVHAKIILLESPTPFIYDLFSLSLTH